MEDKKALIPRNHVNISGKIIYSEGDQAWNLIRLKKEILGEFYQLKEKRSKFSYNMSYYRTYEELEKAIKDMKKSQALPVLVYFYQDESPD